MNYKKSNGLNYILISDTALFQGCSPVETEKLLSGMQFFTKAYKKGVPVYHAGTPVSDIGIVLHGVVQIENNDLWGNKNIISLAQLASSGKGEYSVLIRNLTMISARKNLLLSRRILHTSSKKIRGRLLSYLSHQAELQGSRYIDIPLNRQQLADYLSLDRSALSKELAKMKQDGLLDYHKNSFVLKNV